MRIDFKPLLNSNNISTSVSQLIWVLATIIIGKLVAVYVAPETFGKYNLEFGILSFALTLFISPIIQYYKTKVPQLNLHRNYTPFFLGYALLSVLLSLLVSLILLYYNQNLFELKYVLIAMSYFLFYICYTYMSDYLNVKGKLVILAKFNIIKSLVHVIAIAIGVYFFVESAKILWVAIIVSFIVPFIMFLNKGIHFSKVFVPPNEFNKKYTKELFIFSFPLILMSIASWANNFADRFILEHFYSKYEVGIYNAGYSLGSKVFLMLSPIFLIIITPKIYNLTKDTVGENTSNKIISKYTLHYALIGLLIVAIVFLIKNFIGKVFLSEIYRDSFVVIPWIAFGYLFFTMSIFVNTKFYAFSKTNWLLYINISSAVINLVCNFLLIPKFGIIGAAFSSAISFTSCFIITFILMQKRIFK